MRASTAAEKTRCGPCFSTSRFEKRHAPRRPNYTPSVGSKKGTWNSLIAAVGLAMSTRSLWTTTLGSIHELNWPSTNMLVFLYLAMLAKLRSDVYHNFLWPVHRFHYNRPDYQQPQDY